MLRRGPVWFVSIAVCALLFLMWGGSSAPHRAAAAGETVIAIDGPTLDAVSLQGWAASVIVTVDVLTAGVGMPEPVSVLVDVSGQGFTTLPVALAPGQVVRASQALVVKEITLSALSAQADATADVISGVAPADAVVSVEVCNPACLPAPVATADAAGRFIVSVGSLAFPASDIALGTTFSATITDADGDGQRVEGDVSPTVSATLTGDGLGGTVVLNGWPGFPTASVTLEVFDGPSGPLLASLSAPPDANGFVQIGVPALAIGRLVRASDLTTTKELTLVPLSVQGNTATDELSGSAPPAALVTVQAHCELASTSCALTQLLAADGAGNFSTTVSPVIDILGGSDFSASIADADGDRQYAKVGPTALDTDRDGIEDLIDLDPDPSAAFSVALPVPTFGQVLSDGGLMVTVVHALPPDGVIAAAIGGAPAAVAQVELCPTAFVVDLTAGDVVTLTCGSLTAQVLSGPIEIRVPGFPAVVSIATGTTAELSVAAGELQVLNIAGSGAISVTVDGVTTYVYPPLPTSKEQCKNGGWSSFGRFKNQGECVSFVATKGKNPRGG